MSRQLSELRDAALSADNSAPATTWLFCSPPVPPPCRCAGADGGCALGKGWRTSQWGRGTVGASVGDRRRVGQCKTREREQEGTRCTGICGGIIRGTCKGMECATAARRLVQTQNPLPPGMLKPGKGRRVGRGITDGSTLPSELSSRAF